MKYDVFISYSRKDTAVADRICAVLDRAGISYFIDRQGICGGMEFPDILAGAINECDKVLFLASANSYASKFTNNEIVFAYNEKPRNSIIPYRIDDAPMPAALRFMFAGVNWRTIEEHPIDTVLVDDLLGMLGRSRKKIVAPSAMPSATTLLSAAKRSAVSDSRPVQAKAYKVGDYYNENGRVGVVFSVDASGRHGKIVGMKQSEEELQWCILEEFKKKVVTGATSRSNGLRNQQAIERIAGWHEKYPAFAWCAAQGEGWYLPAVEELKTLLDDAVYKVVNRTLMRQSGTPLFDNRKGDQYYWSSSEKKKDEMNAASVGVVLAFTMNIYKCGSDYVRAVSAF